MKNFAKAVEKINQHGALLVYPMKNAELPLSLWKCLFPRTKMIWSWESEAHSKVAELWYLREELSRSGQVVYTKWFQNRATFFAPQIFVDLLAALRVPETRMRLKGNAEELLSALEMDSPLSTKQLKEISGLQGRLLEGEYNRAMKILWERLLIVGFGEVPDSSFASLAVCATSTQFEELWEEAKRTSAAQAHGRLQAQWEGKSPLWKFYLKVRGAQTLP